MRSAISRSFPGRPFIQLLPKRITQRAIIDSAALNEGGEVFPPRFSERGHLFLVVPAHLGQPFAQGSGALLKLGIDHAQELSTTRRS